MLYEYRHNAKRKRDCPKTFELIRNTGDRDKVATCPNCGDSDTSRIKFQTFAITGSNEPDAFAGDGESEDFDDFDDDDLGEDDFDF